MDFFRRATAYVRNAIFGRDQQPVMRQRHQPISRPTADNRRGKPKTRLKVSQCVVGCQVDQRDLFQFSPKKQIPCELPKEQQNKAQQHGYVWQVSKPTSRQWEDNIQSRAFQEINQLLSVLVEAQSISVQDLSGDYKQLTGRATVVEKEQSISSVMELEDMEDYKVLLADYTLCKYRYQLYFPLLQYEQYNRIQKLWESKLSDQVLLTISNQTLTYKSFKSLKISHWLNDEVVNCYIRLLRDLNIEGVGIVTSHFSGLVAGADKRKIDRLHEKFHLRGKHSIIIPINKRNIHWLFLHIVGGSVYFYDSLRNTNGQQLVESLPEGFVQYLRTYHNVVDWRPTPSDYPFQTNGNDCGAFMLAGIKSIVLGEPDWPWESQDTPYLRRLIARELLQKTLCRREHLQSVQSF